MWMERKVKENIERNVGDIRIIYRKREASGNETIIKTPII